MPKQKKTITFIRHGQSLANAGGITMDHHAIPLTELGVHQAKHLAESLEIEPSVFFVSELVRTHQTAKPFCDKYSIQPTIHPLLNELSCIDPQLIQGMDGKQRRPIADAYWQEADPHKRLGENADTFAEFAQRIDQFLPELETLPDRSVLFGHGIWFGMLVWKVFGFSTHTSQDMKAFRRFQLDFPMPNCAVYCLESPNLGFWNVRAKVL